MTGVGVALGAVGFVMTGEPLWIAAGAAAGATLEWLQRSKVKPTTSAPSFQIRALILSLHTPTFGIIKRR